jgi:hypothetical protein
VAERDYTARDRLAWWAKVLTMASIIAGAALAGAAWVTTRASTDDIARLEAGKEDKANAQRERGRLESTLSRQESVLGNVRDNLIILMQSRRLAPAPLPPALPSVGAQQGQP